MTNQPLTFDQHFQKQLAKRFFTIIAQILTAHHQHQRGQQRHRALRVCLVKYLQTIIRNPEKYIKYNKNNWPNCHNLGNDEVWTKTEYFSLRFFINHPQYYDIESQIIIKPGNPPQVINLCHPHSTYHHQDSTSNNKPSYLQKPWCVHGQPYATIAEAIFAAKKP